MQNWYICLLFLSCMGGLACIDVIDLAPAAEPPDKQLVVEGLITNEGGPHKVRIGYTVSLGNQRFDPAPVRWVEVADDLGHMERLVVLEEGVFALLEQNAVRGEIGRIYTLRFEMENGTQYASTPEPMLPVAEIDTAYFEVNYAERYNDLGRLVNRNFLDLYLDTDLSSAMASPFLRWEPQRWYRFTEPLRPENPLFIPSTCYVQEVVRLNEVLLLDARDADSSRWKRQFLMDREVDWRFYEKTVFAIRQYSLSPSGFSFWQKVDRVVNQSGGIFDSPPGAVQGNIRNLNDPNEKVLGYFGASAVDKVYVGVGRSELSVSFLPFCELPNASYYFGGGVYPCADCLNIPNSSLIRPDFWD